MLNFKITDNGLEVSLAAPTKQELMNYHPDVIVTEQKLYERYSPYMIDEWILIDADKIMGNLSQAPVFMNRKNTVVSYSHDRQQYILIEGDFYFYSDYMTSCFAEKLTQQKSVFFQKA